MGRGKKAITIQDVARTAGVSVSTVSRVLNDKDDVAPETYEKVRDVIREMGYTSSLAARSMRSRRTNVIGLIMPDVGDPFSVQVMRGVNRAITEMGYDLILYTSGSHRWPTTAERERHYVSLLNGSIVDGTIIVTPAATSFSTSAPVVAIDPNTISPDCSSVISTNHAGALAAVEHLISQGHRRIGFISGRPDLQSSQRRLDGYQDALRAAGLPVEQELSVTGDYTRETGFRCARELLSLPEPPTAVFAANDQSAFGVIEAAEEMGLRIPDDLSVVGFDNVPEAAYSNPALTTVDQFIESMGHIGTEILVDLIEGRASDVTHHKIATQLVVRDSCRAVAHSSSAAQQVTV
ncbi:MAG: LacI family DNA-binding transcriptional regulator [Desulfuromonadales bacterium]|jgi:LacI family transcriptional regulator